MQVNKSISLCVYSVYSVYSFYSIYSVNSVYLVYSVNKKQLLFMPFIFINIIIICSSCGSCIVNGWLRYTIHQRYSRFLQPCTLLVPGVPLRSIGYRVDICGTNNPPNPPFPLLIMISQGNFMEKQFLAYKKLKVIFLYNNNVFIIFNPYLFLYLMFSFMMFSTLDSRTLKLGRDLGFLSQQS